jgi:hypothetical protein
MCPTPQDRIVTRDIEKDQAWTRACSPYLIKNDITVKALLTIEAGVEVRVGRGAQLNIGTYPQPGGPLGIRATGTAATPITFRAESNTAQPGEWAGIVFPVGNYASDARFEWVILHDAGGGSSRSTIAVHTSQVALNLQHVTIEQSAGYGLLLSTADARLDPASTDLTIAHSARAPIRVGPDGVGTIPAGHYRGNGMDAIEVTDGGGGGFTRDALWRRHDVPYHILNHQYWASPVTITLEAGTTVELQADVDMTVTKGSFTAEGTATQPIVFTAVDRTRPRWQLQLLTGTSAFKYVTFSYGGGRANCSAGPAMVCIIKDAGGKWPKIEDSQFSDSNPGQASGSASYCIETKGIGRVEYSLAQHNNSFANCGGANGNLNERVS